MPGTHRELAAVGLVDLGHSRPAHVHVVELIGRWHLKQCECTLEATGDDACVPKCVEPHVRRLEAAKHLLDLQRKRVFERRTYEQ